MYNWLNMKDDFTDQERASALAILAQLAKGDIVLGVDSLRTLKDEIYAAIPPRLRQSRGITWVLQRLSRLLIAEVSNPEQLHYIASTLDKAIAREDVLMGVPIFLMAEYGKTNPTQVFPFFEQAADSEDWVVREFAQAGFRWLIKPCRAVALPWLKRMAQSDRPNLRRFVGETLRPVVENQWLNKEPQASLDILRLLFRETHPYPRTSVGNNLSDLSRRNPDLILAVVKELVESGNQNSYWIAYRACRNLVKRVPLQVMDLLHVDEYHYKDRNFYRRVLSGIGE
jgi:3-methyladenine DNA glycosylase AlkC